jgi:hypothetical protein
LFGFIACLEKEHVSEFVAFIMPPNSCLEFIYKLLGSELSVCMWNVMEVLRQCEKQTQYKHNIDWSLRHCICLSAAVWLVDPSADCTDFESCISFIKGSTQIQPPTVPSETDAVPNRIEFLKNCLCSCVQLHRQLMPELARRERELDAPAICNL